MSHSNNDPLREPTDRYSWMSLINSDTLDETAHTEYTGGDGRSDISDPISRPQSQNVHSHQPVARAVASAAYARESVGLLNTVNDGQRDPSDFNRYSVNTVQKAKAMDVVEKMSYDSTETFAHTKWTPYTLRRPYLVFLTLVSLVLSVALAVLCWYSNKNHGLGNDDGSTRLLVGWRYTPTIIAVFFTQAVVQTAEDVKRTEAFARMARPEPVRASFTIFYIPRVWWKSVFEGFSRKRRGGHKGWVLAWSSLASGISILVISTFSSSVFAAKEISIRQTVPLQRYTAGNTPLPIKLKPRRDTYFHTISGFLFNASTSMWVSDSYVVVPFEPVVDRRGLRDGIWNVETEVFQLESNCTPMVITEKTTLNVSYIYADTNNTQCENDTCAVKSKGFKLRSQDGCEVQIQNRVDVWTGFLSLTPQGFLDDVMMKAGGIIWTNMSSSYVSWQDLIQEYGQTPPLRSSGDRALEQWTRTFIYSMSDECFGRDLLLASPPWIVPDHLSSIPSTVWERDSFANLTVQAQVCTPRYHEASMAVTVNTGGSESFVTFDTSQFAQRRQPVPKSMLDYDRLNNITFSTDWNKLMAIPSTQRVHTPVDGFEGVSGLLAQHFSQNLSNILQNDTLGDEASRLRTRFASELLLSSIMDVDVPVLEGVTGEITRVERRILVTTEVGIALAALFFLLACYFITMIWFASNSRRPLHLRSDPATNIGITSLVDAETPLASALRELKQDDRASMQKKLGARIYDMRAGSLCERTDPTEPISGSTPATPPRKNLAWFQAWKRSGWMASRRQDAHKSRKITAKDWRPAMLHKRWLATLLVGLVAIATCILVLRKFAREHRLYRTVFIYQVNLGLFNTSFSPHSVVATLIAVTLGLCWDGIDKPMRTLQPYLSMSRKPTVASQGASLSYQCCYWAWAAVKAASRGHSILCLVTTGTTLSQILIISMAAVFERQAVVQSQTTSDLFDTGLFIRSRLLRQEPFVWGKSGLARGVDLTDTLLQTSRSEWLYNALGEITLRTSQLPWSKDEWVFTPADLTRLPDVNVSQKTGSDRKIHNPADALPSLANISMVTSALRSRLQCYPVNVPESGWLDRAADVWPDRTSEKLDGFALPMVLFDNETYRTPVFTAPRRISCCTNGTALGRQSVVAYWTSNSSMVDVRLSPTATCNFSTVGTDSLSECSYPEALDENYEPLDPNGPADLVVHSPWYRNFTIKWIVGSASSATILSGNLTEGAALPGTEFINSRQAYGSENETLLYFTEQPKMAMMNCNPVIENTTANIIVARSSGQILEYSLLEDSQPAPGAWEYAWDVMYPEPTETDFVGNVSYGHFFMTQLLTAPHIIDPLYSRTWLAYNKSIEDTDNERFNIRDRERGLNVDFMSYANWHLAGKDSAALLNTTTLFAHSEKTFQTFFKHFANTGTANLNGNQGDRYGNNGLPLKPTYENALSPDDVNGTFTTRVEVLAMNEIATWISLVIIFLLILILSILIVSLQVVYPSSCMQRHVECLADVLVMVAGSDELMRVARERGVEGFEKSGVKTKLGWFRDRRGVVRWGVEVVKKDIEWVDGPDKGVIGEEVEEMRIESA